MNETEFLLYLGNLIVHDVCVVIGIYDLQHEKVIHIGKVKLIDKLTFKELNLNT